MISIEHWTIKTSVSGWDTEMRINEDSLATMYLNYTGGRAPKITITADSTLYATPRFLELAMTPPSDLISRLDIKLIANNGIDGQFTMLAPTPDQPLNIQINLDSLFNTNNDIAIYPITLKNIMFTLNSKAEKKEYNIPFEGIYLHYGENIISGLEQPLVQPSESTTAQKLLHNGQLIIIKNNKIYNILGHEITEKY